MSKKLLLHIVIIFSIGFCTTQNTLAFSSELIEVQIQHDSLQKDTSQISPRYFDNLNEKYASTDFIYERNSENSGWWTRFKQWLSDFVKDLFNFKNQGQASKATNIALKIAGVIIFLLVIYFIFKAVINDEGSWVFGKSSDKRIIPVTDIENNIHATDFNTLIKEAETNSNYRLAIRYYYLWLLKQLTEAEIIDYDVEKTNSDYQNEITSKSIKDEFAYTSYLYNYIWYGEFNVSEKQFRNAKHVFINFLSTIKT